MPTIRFFIISCSSGVRCPEPLFVWGEGADHSMPTTRWEAEGRITACQKKEKCLKCDAQIHRIYLSRSRAPGIPYIQEYSRKIGRPRKLHKIPA